MRKAKVANASFVGLPGVEGGKLMGLFVHSPAAAIAGLRDHRAITQASDDGSISVWIDDAGVYRAQFHRYLATIADASFTSKRALRPWLDSWWPAMSDIDLAPAHRCSMTDESPIPAEALEVALRKLSPAMREGLLRTPCRSWWGDSPACMPHRFATGEALLHRGVCRPKVGNAWPLTPLGAALKAHLLSTKESGNG